jgi:tRNA (cytidine/uridine-2'-O-)-methyltransferase
MLRMAACFGVPVDLILPAGFDASDRSFKRAGMDYLAQVDLTRHADFAAFDAARRTRRERLFLLTAHADLAHVDVLYRATDILLVGRESAGVPDAVHTAADVRLRIPMRPGLRSLNVAVAAAIVLSEALRQTGGFTRPINPS